MSVLPERREAAATLVCLDAVEPVTANTAAPGAPQWRASAAALLAHARAHGWSVAHVLRRRPAPGQGGWRPAPGLSPLPSEPVFHREGMSAFQCPGFARLAGRRLVMVGHSVDGACLATALDAVRLGLRLVLPQDALSLSTRELSGLQGLAAIADKLADVPLTLATTRQLLGGLAEVRVIRGGRG